MPDTVRETFDQLRQFLKSDLRQILAQEQGGNYAVALLIAVACEALSQLQGLPDDEMLVQLFSKQGLSREMARDVAEALRHGLAHIYETKFIQAGKLRFELVVSWGKKPHLKVRKNPPGIYLNVRAMSDDLREILRDLDQNLPPGGALPRRWLKKRFHQAQPKSITQWQKWFAEHLEDGP